MKIGQILKELEYNYGRFPREAVEAAIFHREQITPKLLQIMEGARQNAEVLLRQEDYIAHIYALYLLAQFRETRAYSLIVDFFSMPGDIALNLTGDLVTESLGHILASVSGGDTSLMRSLIENERANEWVRGAATEGLLCLVASDEVSQDEIVAYFESLFRNRLKREPSHVWNALVASSADLHSQELYEHIEQAFADDLVDDGFIDLQYVQEKLAVDKDKALERLRGDRTYRLIKDTIREMEWWACFQPPRQPDAAIQRKKVGRNQPCPCGSGQKYKRCCGRKGDRDGRGPRG